MAVQVKGAGQVAWFAARTKYGQEIGIRNRLREMEGVEFFIPTRMRRNYRGKLKEHPVITNLVFIRTTRQRAFDLQNDEGLPVRYLFDYVRHVTLTVPDKQMEDFMKVFEVNLSEGGLVDQPLELGERVRITKGPLKDVEGNVLELHGKIFVVVGLCGMVYAKARVPRAWLEKVNEDNIH